MSWQLSFGETDIILSRLNPSVPNTDSTPLPRSSEPKGAAPYSDDPDEIREEENQGPGHFEGWRMSVTICMATTGTVLMINLVLAVFEYTIYGLSGVLGPFMKGAAKGPKSSVYGVIRQ